MVITINRFLLIALFTINTAGYTYSQKTTYKQIPPPPMIMKCEQIMVAARLSAEQRQVWENYRQTLPIPVLKNKKVTLVFLYYNSLNKPNKPSIIDHPAWLQTVDYSSGEMVEILPCTPERFGLVNNHDPIGELAMPAGMSFSDFMEAQKELLSLLDRLLPAFQAWDNRTEVDRANIKRFQELFDKISEPPLKPYYEAIGYNWFHWLKQ